MPRGGARQGAGRKPNRETFEREVLRVEKKIAKQSMELVELEMKLARGDIKYYDEQKQAIYSIPPSRHAVEYLLNRLMGKPTERAESEVNIKHFELIMENYARCVRDVLDERLDPTLAMDLMQDVDEKFTEFCSELQ